MTLAVGLRMDGFQEGAVGYPKADAVREIDWVLRSLACQHRSISPGGWGHGIQSGLWAATAAYGAWLVWDQLLPQTRQMVAVMMHDEAEYVAGRPRRVLGEPTGRGDAGARRGQCSGGDGLGRQLARPDDADDAERLARRSLAAEGDADGGGLLCLPSGHVEHGTS